jgi:SAM-dependent methyltransferase
MKYQLTPDYWSHYKRLEFIKSHLSRYKNPRVLDLACGTGVLCAFPLAELGYDVTGVDIDPRSIKAAVAENPFPNLRFFCSDFNEFHPNTQYDVIIAGYVMEHLERPETLMVAIARLLKPNGTAIITIPNGYGPHEIEQAIYYRFFEPWDFIYKIRFFNQGLTAIKMRYLLGERDWPWPKYKPPLDKLEMTVNTECGHAVNITQNWFNQMVADHGFYVNEMQNGALLHGQITGHIMCNFRPTILFNTGVADYLPSCVVSNWFYALKQEVPA